MTDTEIKSYFSQESTSEVLEIIEKTVKKFRDEVLENAGSIDFEDKEDGTPVTELDGQIEVAIVKEIHEVFPGIPVHGEEGGIPDNLTGSYWLLDPIDGTKSFIKGIPAYTAMAVLINNDQAEASLIYNYATDDVYVARKNKGAYKNGRRISFDKIAVPKLAYCRKKLVEPLNNLLKSSNAGVMSEVGPVGAGFGFTAVVDGLIGARFNFPYEPGGGFVHDYAPGALLVLEAGGSVLSVESEVYSSETRSFVACHPALKEKIKEISTEIRKIEQDLA